MIRRLIFALVAILTFLACASVALAQGGGVTLVQSSVEPLPNCTPAVQGTLQPTVWDITSNSMKWCTATNTWTGGGGSGGTISGSIAAGQVAFGAGTDAIAGSNNATLDLSGNLTLAGTLTLSPLTSVTALATNSSGVLVAASYQGNGSLVQLSTGSTTPNDCAEYDANGNITDAGTPCGSGGGGGITSITFSAPLTGGTITTTGTVGCPTCLLGSSLSVGIVHALGSSQTLTSSAVNLASADVTGLLPNANLAHSTMNLNETTCTLGTSLCSVVTFTTSSVSNLNQAGLNFIPSTTNAAGFTVTPINPALGNERFEVTGTLAGGSFPALTGDTTTTGGSLVTTTSKINGNSVPTGIANHQVFLGTGTSTVAFKTVPDCAASNDALQFTQSTNAFSCATSAGFANVMTTLGDTTYGGASGVPTRLAGPTGVNGVPQVYTEIPSGSAAVAPSWQPGGIPGRIYTGTGSDPVLPTDRAGMIQYTNSGAIAASIAAAGSTGFASNFVYAPFVTGAGTMTLTPATSTVNGQATLGVGPNTWCSVATPDNSNYLARCATWIKAGVGLTPTYNADTSTTLALTLPILTGTTGSIGGSLLTIGTCSSGMVTVTGATTSMGVVATPATYPGDGNYWYGYVSSTNTVTVKICAVATLTPSASTYTVRVQ